MTRPATMALVALAALLSGCDGARARPPRAAAQEGNSSESSPVRLYVLDGGSTWISDKGRFGPEYEGAGPFELEVTAFLIVHPEGTLLWDSGHSDEYLQRGGDHVEGMRIQVDRGLLPQLAELGLGPDDIDLLAASHWHFDHVGNFALFSAERTGADGKATIVIGQRDEYDLAFGPDAAATFGMDPRTYAALANNPTDLFVGDRDVFGDGSVRILRVGGHTVGSQVLWVDLEEHGPVLLSGDLWHFAEQYEHGRVPPFNHDYGNTLAGMKRVQAFLAGHPDTELWITHDPGQMRSLSLSPTFYE